jgi:hypothetical protein
MNHEISLGKFCEIKYEEKFDKYFTKQEILTFQNFRKTMIPNSFAMVKNSSWDWIENEIPLSYWTAMKLSSSIPN